MIVIVLTACPVGLRGDLTRWLLEISPGVFVGRISARVRERLWERVTDLCKNGRAIMVYSARNEQHLAFRVHQSDWVPTDCDGLELIKRPAAESDSGNRNRRRGWSNASKYRHVKRYAK